MQFEWKLFMISKSNSKVLRSIDSVLLQANDLQMLEELDVVQRAALKVESSLLTRVQAFIYILYSVLCGAIDAHNVSSSIFEEIIYDII